MSKSPKSSLDKCLGPPVPCTQINKAAALGVWGQSPHTPPLGEKIEIQGPPVPCTQINETAALGVWGQGPHTPPLGEKIQDARVFMAFCDDTRLNILGLLRSGEKCAHALLAQVNVCQSTLSHHMKILVDSGVVTARKAGKWTYYSICESGRRYAAELLKTLCGMDTNAQCPSFG